MRYFDVRLALRLLSSVLPIVRGLCMHVESKYSSIFVEMLIMQTGE